MAPNPHIAQRLAGIQTILRGVHQSGQSLSSASKGDERAHFIDDFLANVLPAPFRFGRGDITDVKGARSGQVDVVVEYPFLPSLPSPGTDGPRLYLAGGVAAVVEVKSDLAAQWPEVLDTAAKIAALERDLKPLFYYGDEPFPRIPVFAAGYVGWKQVSTLKQNLDPDLIQGILVIDPGLFVSTTTFQGIEGAGPWSLWGLISCLHQSTTTVKISDAHPMSYAV